MFKLDNDIILLTVYVPPAGSPYYDNFIIKNGIYNLERLLYECISEHNSCNVILCGDFNARTANLQPINEIDSNIGVFESINSNNIDECLLLKRQSDDFVTNSFGKSLVELCVCFELVILNGIGEGEMDGGFTFISPNGNSVVDYFIVSNSLVDSLRPTISVINSINSWHLPITLSVSLTDDNLTSNSSGTYNRIIWDENKVNEFVHAINNDDSVTNIRKAYEHIEHNNIDGAVACYNTILIEASSCMVKRIPKSTAICNAPEWFDVDCKNLKRTVQKNLRHFRKTKRDREKDVYIQNRKQYKQMIYCKRKEFNKRKIKHIRSNINNPSIFWREVNKVCKTTRSKNNISLEAWHNHFKTLYNNINISHPDDSCFNSPTVVYNELNNPDQDHELNSEISEQEIGESIANLKRKKSAGHDEICNEMMKCSIPLSTNFLKVLFNYIFVNGVFPKEWSKSVIVPIHKKGDINLTDNYRGISLISTVSKVYTFILNKRLKDWCDENKIVIEEQAGFRRGYSTIDQIFILHSIIHKQFSLNRKLYVAFVDFHKAFDLVNRNLLWSVLKKIGIKENSHMFQALTSIYADVKAAVRGKDGETSEYFDYPLGVKQGCNLSPQLFVLFINELAAEIASNGKHGIQLVPNEKELFLLLFADDMALMSYNPKGLQNQLNELEKHTKRFNLKINESKTKIMVFRKGGYLGKYEKWWLNGELLEVVNSYKYLGIEFSTRLSTSNITSAAAPKARKATYDILRYMKSLQCHNIDVFSKLFSSKIQPILLYGSEIWGVHESKEIERVHTFAFKTFLNVSLHCSNSLLYGDTGRYPLSICTTINA